MSDVDWLERELERTGMPQDALAGVLGIPPASVSRLRKGKRRLSVAERALAARLFALVPVDASPSLLKAVKALKTSRVRERVGFALLDAFAQRQQEKGNDPALPVGILTLFGSLAEAIRARNTVLRADQIVEAAMALGEPLPRLIERTKPAKRQPPRDDVTENWWLAAAEPYHASAASVDATFRFSLSASARAPSAAAPSFSSQGASLAHSKTRPSGEGASSERSAVRSFIGDGHADLIRTESWEGMRASVFKLHFADKSGRFRSGDVLWATDASPRTLERDKMIIAIQREGGKGGGRAIVGRVVECREGSIQLDSGEGWINLEEEDMVVLRVRRVDFRK